MNNAIKNNWNDRSDAYFEAVGSYEKIIENPSRAFPVRMYPLIQKYMVNLQGKNVCVPSSGDNVAAFGFHLLGTRVTSCDLSENKINEDDKNRFNWPGDTFDWKNNPRAALPQCLSLCSQKV